MTSIITLENLHEDYPDEELDFEEWDDEEPWKLRAGWTSCDKEDKRVAANWWLMQDI